MTDRPDFVVRQGDTLPRFTATIKDADGVPVDLGAGTVMLHMHGMTADKEISILAHIADSEQGVVFYDWTASDTNTPGFFAAEFEVTFSNGQVQTFPNGGHFLVEVTQQIA